MTATVEVDDVDADAVADRMIAAIESGDIEQVVAVYAQTGRQIHPFSPDPIEGHEGIRASDGALLTAFPDVRIDRRSAVARGRTVIVELVLRATHRGPLELGEGETLEPTGRPIAIPSVWVLELDAAGLVTEERAYFDSAEFFRQLGLQE